MYRAVGVCSWKDFSAKPGDTFVDAVIEALPPTVQAALMGPGGLEYVDDPEEPTPLHKPKDDE